MKRFTFVLVLFALFLSACGTDTPTAPAPVPTEASLPVVQVDSQHMITPNLAYEIPAGPGFVLDASGYNFGTAGGPSAVQVVFGGKAYQGIWAGGASAQTVLAADLHPVNAAAPLTGFSAGVQMIVAIGTLSAQGRFAPLWVGVVNVK